MGVSALSSVPGLQFMGIPFNELNRAFDLGFRALPHGNNCYLPSQLQEVGHLTDPPARPGNPPMAQPSRTERIDRCALGEKLYLPSIHL
jgi:hypothetical protein